MVSDSSPEVPADSTNESKVEAQKKMVEEIKVQWKLLWSERFDDKIRAEGVSVKDYATLLVERGTIIHATRDCKALNFKEILEQKMIENPERYVAPNVNTGGWNKFIKAEIKPTKNKGHSRRDAYNATEKISSKQDPPQQPKKGGRGWLHKTVVL